MNDNQVGMIGLGLMGTAITERLLAAQFSVHVYDRIIEKANPLIAQGAKWSNNPLSECDRVLISVFSDKDVNDALQHLQSDEQRCSVIVDMTTGDPGASIELGLRLASRGIQYLEAPIVGSSEQVRRGEVTALVSGEHEAFDQCQDLFNSFCLKTFYVGSRGNGAKLKLVTNLVLGLNRAALAEGLVFARSLGLNAEDTLNVLKSTIAYSRIMDTKGHKMVNGNFNAEGKLSQHLKDVRIMLEAAFEASCSLPFCGTLRDVLENAEAAGLGDADNSAIICALSSSPIAEEVPTAIGPPHFKDFAHVDGQVSLDR